MVIGPGRSKNGHWARQEYGCSLGKAGVRVWSLGQAEVRVVIGPGRSKGGHWARQE